MHTAPNPQSIDRVMSLFRKALEPASATLLELADPAISPDGEVIAGAAIASRTIDAPHTQRLCLVDRATGEIIEPARAGGGVDKKPAWSPDGSWIAFLSARGSSALTDVWLRNRISGEERKIELPENWAEYVRWSPNSGTLLIGAAGLDADTAGIDGATTTSAAASRTERWAPQVFDGARKAQWRSLWTFDINSGATRQVSPSNVNIWEATWCGDSIVCIASDSPSEDSWYSANIRILDPSRGTLTPIYETATQIAWLSASPNGDRIAVASGLASDRFLLAGALHVGRSNGDFKAFDTRGVDVTQTSWVSNHTLIFCGIRGLETVIGKLNCDTAECHELWSSEDLTLGGPGNFLPSASTAGNFVSFVSEGHFVPPCIVVLDSQDGRTSQPLSFGAFDCRGRTQPRKWTAPDGLEIEGYLLTPESAPPYPLILHVHGGPVWAFRPSFLGRATPVAALLEAGYAILQANPRGSMGRGLEFTRLVYGDPGGADVGDLLAGIDALVAQRIADPQRLGIMGTSYGGFMASWIITQDTRFAASVAISPVTNWLSERHTSNVPKFTDDFLRDPYDDLSGRYFSRSPVLFARNVKTPTLNIAGALDNITPPTQAIEFHNALLDAGSKSELVIYPLEGHAIRQFPAVIDCTARTLDWFEQHMPPT